LHESVDDCRSHTPESSLYEIFTYEFCFWRFGRYLAWVPELADYRLIVHKVPNVAVKGPKLFYYLHGMRKNVDKDNKKP